VITAVVPTRGAEERLARYLPSVRASLEASGDTWEIVVVDDGGALRAVPEGTRCLPLTPGRGYGPAVNAGAQAARGDLLLVLNDDVSLEPSTVRLLRERLLADDGVFAVAPRIASPLARCGDEGGKAARVEAGLVQIEEAPSDEAHPTFYPVGCCYLCRRASFLELGAYDDVYAPYFWEDVDLGYRAWRAGLASIHEPRAVCHHQGSATIGERPMAERLRTWHRNAALFHLRNLQDPQLRAGSLGAWAAHALFDGRPAIEEGLVEALERFARVGRRADAGLSDEEIFARVSPR
jgi:GT2 family glycosyltransferase